MNRNEDKFEITKKLTCRCPHIEFHTWSEKDENKSEKKEQITQTFQTIKKL